MPLIPLLIKHQEVGNMQYISCDMMLSYFLYIQQSLYQPGVAHSMPYQSQTQYETYNYLTSVVYKLFSYCQVPMLLLLQVNNSGISTLLLSV